MIMSQTKAVIEKGRQRNRLDSRPIVTGIENVNEKGNSEITDKKRKRTRLFSLPICTRNIDRNEENISEILEVVCKYKWNSEIIENVQAHIALNEAETVKNYIIVN